MIIIGKKNSGTRNAVEKAIEERDEVFILSQTKAQEEAGAHYYLDI